MDGRDGLNAHARLSRMLGGDPEITSIEETNQLALTVSNVNGSCSGINCRGRNDFAGTDRTVVFLGSGEFLAQAAGTTIHSAWIAKTGDPLASFRPGSCWQEISAAPALTPWQSWRKDMSLPLWSSSNWAGVSSISRFGSAVATVGRESAWARLCFVSGAALLRMPSRLSRIHGLSDEICHWMAIQDGLTGELIKSLLPESTMFRILAIGRQSSPGSAGPWRFARTTSPGPVRFPTTGV